MVLGPAAEQADLLIAPHEPAVESDRKRMQSARLPLFGKAARHERRAIAESQQLDQLDTGAAADKQLADLAVERRSVAFRTVVDHELGLAIPLEYEQASGKAAQSLVLAVMSERDQQRTGDPNAARHINECSVLREHGIESRQRIAVLPAQPVVIAADQIGIANGRRRQRSVQDPFGRLGQRLGSRMKTVHKACAPSFEVKMSNGSRRIGRREIRLVLRAERFPQPGIVIAVAAGRAARGNSRQVERHQRVGPRRVQHGRALGDDVGIRPVQIAQPFFQRTVHRAYLYWLISQS